MSSSPGPAPLGDALYDPAPRPFHGGGTLPFTLADVRINLVPLYGALAAGVLLLALPRLWRRVTGAIGLTRSLVRGSRAREYDFDRIRAYHDRVKDERLSDVIDDRTWDDIDMNDVLIAVDRTESRIGQQYLYRALRAPHYDAGPMMRLESAVRRVASDPALASRLRSELAHLSDPRAGLLVELILGELPPRPRAWWIFPLFTAAAVGCLALTLVWTKGLLLWLGLCAVAVGVQVAYKGRVQQIAPALQRIPALSRAARGIGGLDARELEPALEMLRAGVPRLRTLQAASRWLVFESATANELVGTLYEYANLLFFLDTNAFVFGVGAARAERDTLRTMYDAIGWLDLVQSIAAWRSELLRWTTPDFTGAVKEMAVSEVDHPLLASSIPNSIHVAGRSILITGSNMSGKTTFVRTIGVKCVLAQTLHTACAESWRAPMLAVRASIGRGDSVLEGKSYYLSEVETILTLIRAREDHRQHIFLIDEIFRGTNTTERVAAGHAILSYLNAGADIVLVATHDLELLPMLEGAYAPFHFRERIEAGALHFDYTIRPGPSSTRNAIALLELTGYPPAIVEDALRSVERLERSRA